VVIGCDKESEAGVWDESFPFFAISFRAIRGMEFFVRRSLAVELIYSSASIAQWE
jgi:hypothetical protein